MPVNPNFLERLLVLRLNKGPHTDLGPVRCCEFRGYSEALETARTELARLALKTVLRYGWRLLQRRSRIDYDAAFVFDIIHSTIARRTTGCSNVSVRLSNRVAKLPSSISWRDCSNAYRENRDRVRRVDLFDNTWCGTASI